MKPTPCRGCGKPIVFAINKDTGMVIPLDPKPPVYAVVEEADGEIVCKRLELAMVSHFATCSKANEFSGKNRKPDGGGV